MDYSTIRDHNRRAYDTLADQYQERAERFLPSAVRRVRALLAFMPPEARVADVGCGVGLAVSEFSRHGFDVTGIDISPRMAEYCRRRNPNVPVIVGDFMDLKLPNNFHLVFAQSFIHLFPRNKSEELFLRFRDMLSPGGILAVCTNVSAAGREVWLPKEDYLRSPDRFKRFWLRGELYRAVEESGLIIADEQITQDPRGKKFIEICCRRPKESTYG